MGNSVVLTKAGPRLIDIYRDVVELSIIVNGPGMLYEKLELMTNRSAIEGATVGFYKKLANELEATIDCPHEPIRRAEITVVPHRLGAELSVELGPVSMYQSELKLRTANGGTFRELIDHALGTQDDHFSEDTTVIAVLVAVRATGHHEHHPSAHAVLNEKANVSTSSGRDQGAETDPKHVDEQRGLH